MTEDLTTPEKERIIIVSPGTRGTVRRRNRKRTVYGVMRTDSWDTSLAEVFDTRGKAETYIAGCIPPEDYYIVPRKLK